jgi:hypothetical protein
MAKDGKKTEKQGDHLWCECECINCEIGAHERCNSAKCHMPKWKDVKDRSPKRDH